jgi:hypothetical protein
MLIEILSIPVVQLAILLNIICWSMLIYDFWGFWR